jgi:hypothetical protein
MFMKKIIFSILALGSLILPSIAAAAVQIGDPLGLESGNPIPLLANRFIQAALGISGVLALIAFIYGGLLYLLAGVNPKNVDKGKEMMKYAVLGLFIIFTAYAVITFFLRNVLQAPG